MGANHSHLPSTRRSSRTSSSRTTPAAATTSTFTSAPSTAYGSPATTYTSTSTYTSSSSSPTSFSAPSDERTSISCEPSTSPISSRNNVPLRIGYPYYEDLTALEAKRGSRRRSKSLSKVLDTIGFSGGGR